jgi:hypothetical protein
MIGWGSKMMEKERNRKESKSFKKSVYFRCDENLF